MMVSVGEDLKSLRALVNTTLIGVNDGVADDQDGLSEITAFLAGSVDPGMPLQVAASRFWIDSNPQVYAKFAAYHLQPITKECHAKLGDPKKQTCELAQGTPGQPQTSPDFHTNLILLQNTLLRIPNPQWKTDTVSLTYYLHDVAMPNCPFFGTHLGVITFDPPTP